MRRYRHKRHGYTAVELMMSIAVMALGVSGVIAMQKVTATSNRYAKSLVTATHIGEAWLEQLVAESSQWQQSGQFGNTNWLGEVGNGWQALNYSTARGFGSLFDGQGNPRQGSGHFCAQVRLSWLYAETTTNNEGAGVMRAEVRVLWQRNNVKELSAPAPAYPCANEPYIDTPDGERLYHRVHLSTTILQGGGGT